MMGMIVKTVEKYRLMVKEGTTKAGDPYVLVQIRNMGQKLSLFAQADLAPVLKELEGQPCYLVMEYLSRKTKEGYTTSFQIIDVLPDDISKVSESD